MAGFYFDDYGIILIIALAFLIAVCLYFIIKYAVKNGIKEAYCEIKGIDVTEENVQPEQSREDIKENEV